MQLITIGRGRTRARVCPELGGRLAQLEVRPGEAWLPLLWEPAAPPDQRDPLAWGCYAMLPWPNRIAGGRFSFDGVEVSGMSGAYHLANGDAIHGLGFMRAWTIEDQRSERCALSLDLKGLWPFAGRARQTITVFDDGVEMTIELHATGQRFPAGAGWHPWFRRDVRTSEPPRMQVDADKAYVLASDQIPSGALASVDAARDLRAFPAIGDRRLDDCYSNVGDPMRIAWADLTLTMRSSATVRHAVVYTPEHAVCLEPQTSAIDAFNLEARGMPGTGVALVQTGDPLIVATRWRWNIGQTPGV